MDILAIVLAVVFLKKCLGTLRGALLCYYSWGYVARFGSQGFNYSGVSFIKATLLVNSFNEALLYLPFRAYISSAVRGELVNIMRWYGYFINKDTIQVVHLMLEDLSMQTPALKRA